MNTFTADLRTAAVISFILVLPLALLEFLSQPIDRQNAPGLIMLFGLLWLFPLASVVILMPLARNLRAGRGLMANPLGLSLRVVSLAFIVTMWTRLLVDQMHCFMGVPNCD